MNASANRAVRDSSGGGRVEVHAQAEVVDPREGAVAAPDLVGPLVDDLHPERLQHRQHRRERDPAPDEVELEAPVAALGVGVGPVGPVEPHGHVVGAAEAVEHQEVGHAAGRGEVLLVGLAEWFAGGRDRGAHPGTGRGPQAVGPGACGLRELGGQRRDVGPGRVAVAGVHGDVQERELVLGHPGRVLDVGALEPVEEQLLHPQPGRRGVAVAREVDHRREVATPTVPAQEEPQAAALGQLEDPGHRLLQGRPVGAEQLRARVGLQHLEHPLARPRLERQPRPGDDLLDPSRHERDPEDVRAAGGDREHAEEAVLGDDPALAVEDPHRDRERVHRAVDRGPGARAREDQQPAVRARGRAGQDESVVLRTAGEGGAAVAEDPRPVGGAVAHHPVAQERQVPVGEPAQQAHGVGDLVRGDRRLVVLHPVGQGQGALHHRRAVLDHGPDVLQDAGQTVVQVGGETADRVRGARPRGRGVGLDLEVHPRLGEGARGGVGTDRRRPAPRAGPPRRRGGPSRRGGPPGAP